MWIGYEKLGGVARGGRRATLRPVSDLPALCVGDDVGADDELRIDNKHGHMLTGDDKMNVVFVTHFCPHYRVKTFETLARTANVDYFFYSPGNEWYGQGVTGTWRGDFRHEYLPGFQMTR